MKDFDNWTETGKAYNWLAENKATELSQGWGFVFYENPFKGQDAPVLAVKDDLRPAGTVWNTQDFDLPTSNPMCEW